MLRSDSSHEIPATPLPRLPELEGVVMEQIWAAGESSVRDVMSALNESLDNGRAYTTYMTIMERLRKKGLLLRRRDGKTNHYRPAHAREEYMSSRARVEVDDLVAQYGEVALSHFARQMASLDPARRRWLERQLDAR
jgi:predicted transcriptional regulator